MQVHGIEIDDERYAASKQRFESSRAHEHRIRLSFDQIVERFASRRSFQTIKRESGITTQGLRHVRTRYLRDVLPEGLLDGKKRWRTLREMDLAAKAQRPPTRGLEAIVWRKAKEYGYPIRRVSPPSRSSIRPMDFLINGYRVRVHFVRAVMHPKLGGKQAYGCLRTSTSSLATTDFSIVIGKFERRKPIAFIAPSSLIFDHFEGKHGSKVFYLPLDEGLNRTSFWLGLIDAWYLLKEPPASMIEEEVVPYGRTR